MTGLFWIRGGLWLILLLAFAFTGCSPGREGAGRPEIQVFAAASLSDALTELADAFAEQTGVLPIYNFAGSNTLALQIEAAPLADVFLSADERWMDYLEAKGRTLPGSRRTFLSNRLAIIANRAGSFELLEPAQLAVIPFRYLALADPEAVPAGRYAKSFLESVPVAETDLWNRLQDRVIPTLDVRAALHLVEAEPDIVGIVYRTDARISRKARVLMEIPAGESPLIRYSAALIRDSLQPAAGAQFLEFLGSAQAARVFDSHGFVGMAGE